MNTIKVITLTQPWATLVAIGAKRIETRSWHTNYRGPLAIHAAKGLAAIGGKREYLEFCTANETVYAALEKAGLVPFTWSEEALMSLPFGKIIAVCELYSLRPTSGAGSTWVADLSEEERSFGNYGPKRWGWQLNNVRALSEPIPVKGSLGLWDWQPPEGFEL